jgi:hypothetical protein
MYSRAPDVYVARAADSNLRAKEKAAELLKNARDVVLGIAQEALGGNNSEVASNNNTGMASSNVFCFCENDWFPGFNKTNCIAE